MKLKVFQPRSPLLFVLKAVTISLLLMASAAKAVCPTAEQTCTIFPPAIGMSCVPSGDSYACAYEDCLGKNTGAEITLVPGGAYPGLWVARTDGSFEDHPGALNCLRTDLPRGTSLIAFPEELHCAALLVTETNVYLEFFASNPLSECYGWVECVCEW
jgi:hypothetical protein